MKSFPGTIVFNQFPGNSFVYKNILINSKKDVVLDVSIF